MPEFDEVSAEGVVSEQVTPPEGVTPGTVELDARRLLCPMPVIRTQDLVRTLAAGATITVRCTDPGALHDVPTWCRIHGHVVLGTEQDADEIRIRIKVAG